MPGKLQIRDLSVHLKTDRGQLQAVRGVDLDLSEGKVMALVGESGSGKTITAKTIMGLLPGNATVVSGEILLDDINLLRLKGRKMDDLRGSRIAMVFQDPMSALDPIVTIGKQLTEAMRLKGRLSPAQAKARALALMEEVGIDDPKRRYGQYPFQCSGGICQRVVIAMALSADPELLICDEPTTALDVTIQAQILELIHELQKKRSLTVLFISHDMGVVADIADAVAVMYAGRIVELGTTEDIFYRPAHPYIWALLSAVPDPEGIAPMQTIPGTPPDMVSPPFRGCLCSPESLRHGDRSGAVAPHVHHQPHPPGGDLAPAPQCPKSTRPP